MSDIFVFISFLSKKVLFSLLNFNLHIALDKTGYPDCIFSYFSKKNAMVLRNASAMDF